MADNDKSFSTAVGSNIVRVIEGQTYSWAPLTLKQIGDFVNKNKALKVAEAIETNKELKLTGQEAGTLLTNIKTNCSRLDSIYDYVYTPSGCLDIFTAAFIPAEGQKIPSNTEVIISVALELLGIKPRGANPEGDNKSDLKVS